MCANPVVADPGEITAEQIREQIANPGRLPFWKMHPAVQTCIRSLKKNHPEVVEYFCTDAGGLWVTDNHSIENMFLDAYRVLSENFDIHFVSTMSVAHRWEYRHDLGQATTKVA